MDPTTLLALEAFPARLESHYTCIPPERRHWKPPMWDGIPSEPLTAIEQICHVRDIEIDGYQVRLRRVVAEQHPLLPSIDTDAYARDRSYVTADVEAVFASFRTARAQTVAFIRDLPPAAFARSAELEGYGVTTLRGLVHFLCGHDQQHLAGLQWLLGKMEAARVSSAGSASRTIDSPV